MYRDPMDIMDEFDEMFRRLRAEFRQGFSMNPALCTTDRDGCSTCVRMTWSGPVCDPEVDADRCDDRVRSTPCSDCAGSSNHAPWEEPATEVQHGSDGLTATTSLPGVTEENVSIAVGNNRIVIDAVCSDRHYHDEIPVPHGVDAGSIRHTIRNGVLEIACGAASQ